MNGTHCLSGARSPAWHSGDVSLLLVVDSRLPGNLANDCVLWSSKLLGRTGVSPGLARVELNGGVPSFPLPTLECRLCRAGVMGSYPRGLFGAFLLGMRLP